MKKYFILAAAAAMFAACSNNDDLAQGETPTERIPLMIGAATGNLAVNSTMRGIHTTLQNDTLSKDVKVGLYIFKEGNKTHTTGEDYEKTNEQMGGTTTTTGKLDITPVATSTTLVYPDKKDQGIDLYAYAPYASSGAPTDLSSGTLSVTTKQDQTSNTNYYASDFLWGSVGNGIENSSTILSTQPSHYIISATQYQADKTTSQDGYDGTKTGKILLPLYHVGSKIVINLIPEGMDIAKLRGATVKFYTNYDTGDLNITTGAISNLAKSSGTDPIAITLTNAKLGRNDDGTDITTYTDGKHGDYSTTSSLEGYSCAAVILPQDVNWDGSVVQSATYKLIEITMPGTGTATTYAYTVSAKQTYAPLKVYTYNIKVKASGLTVTTQVTNWESVAPENHDATLQ